MAQILFVPFVGGPDLNPVVETFAGTTYNMTSADANKIIRCTNANPITVNVQANQAPGTTTEFVQEGAGAITVAGVGVTIRVPAFFDPTTAQQYSTVVVSVLDDNEAVIRGDLAAA